jgi:hypothetical protein
MKICTLSGNIDGRADDVGGRFRSWAINSRGRARRVDPLLQDVIQPRFSVTMDFPWLRRSSRSNQPYDGFIQFFESRTQMTLALLVVAFSRTPQEFRRRAMASARYRQ